MSDSGHDFDFIVIGSGFGGSVTAHRLTEKGYRVAVMEMGRRWTPENLPSTNWLIWRWFWRPRLALRGFFNMEYFKHVTILHGCAVGGGSITYANTMLVPQNSVWDSGSWAGLADWKREMPRHYETAVRTLGVVENRILGPADHVLKQAAEAVGVGHTFYRTNVAVFEPPEGEAGGKTYPDPYFGGEGPERCTCIACGGCMVGCRYHAKNSLDKNYLYLAEKHGAQVFDETKVVDVTPLGAVDGSAGYEVRTVNSISLFRKHARRFTCRGVVFAASALGSMDLLFRLKLKGSLPSLSDQLGNRVRTNAESLIGVRVPGSREDFSKGIAIGSGIYLDDYTHIEAVRYPAGSDAMGPLATMLTGGRPGHTRIFSWLGTLFGSLLRHPIRTARALHPFGWARESIIFLCMQTLDRHIDMRLRRRVVLWPFRKDPGEPGPEGPHVSSRQANEFAAQGRATERAVPPMSMLTGDSLQRPRHRAHCLGGAVRSPDSPTGSGVVDHRNRVFGYRNMYVCDGSVVGRQLGRQSRASRFAR
jgi:cholesterol oxidase